MLLDERYRRSAFLFVVNKLTIFPKPPFVALGSGDDKGPHRLLFFKLHNVLMPR